MRRTLPYLAWIIFGASFLITGAPEVGPDGSITSISAAQAQRKKKRRKKKPVKKRRKKKRRVKEQRQPKPEEAPTQPTAEASAEAKAAAPKAGPDAPSLRRSDAMEFDARLVQGERASGAVYLFQRTPRALPGMVNLKRRYADRVTLPLLHRRAAAPKPEATP